MKIRVTLEISDSVRQYIADMVEDCPKSSGGLASRAACIAFLYRLVHEIHRGQVQFLSRLTDARNEVHFGPLTDKDIGDANDAVSYLRAQGKSDPGIREWLIKQRARAAITHEKINLGFRS